MLTAPKAKSRLEYDAPADGSSAARGDERPILRHRRHPVTHRQRSELFGPAAEEYVGSDDERTGL